MSNRICHIASMGRLYVYLLIDPMISHRHQPFMWVNKIYRSCHGCGKYVCHLCFLLSHNHSPRLTLEKRYSVNSLESSNQTHIFLGGGKTTPLGCSRKLGSMVKLGSMAYNLLTNGVYLRYNPPTNHLLTSWNMQAPQNS